ncbi:MAG TPA: monovalent cation/H(+) antiporter subunit G [Bacillota bacterium]|nr:monovalent cation/H(+) antiporter subunit G [Bacillota bacterium]HPW39947.1 monovalent cation/H(+) antiporter subunit G [Bacillota bacterium]
MKTVLMYVLMSGGLFFLFVGTIGLLRLPDVMTRVHSAAKCDTLGALLCITALIFYSGGGFVGLKLILVIVFLWITNPTATHLIAKAEMSHQENADRYETIDEVEVKRDENI